MTRDSNQDQMIMMMQFRRVSPISRRLYTNQTQPPKLSLRSLALPFAKVFLTGSVTYFGLMLLWYQLDYPVTERELEEQVSKLRNELTEAVEQQKKAAGGAATTAAAAASAAAPGQDPSKSTWLW
ncbi:hypothetical protein TRVA0_050S00606 [Trichomonascus vanleenenianus]|uniref:uncharacterized protein n=1 Tax=Trichomonascus vanleenenianus TaxID=2268995 RepID=UPI003ECB9B89